MTTFPSRCAALAPLGPRPSRVTAAGMTGLLLSLGLAGACGPAQAHHGLANFNLNVDISVEGKIADIALINPHSWIYVDVSKADGSQSRWKCELRGGTVLRRSAGPKRCSKSAPP